MGFIEYYKAHSKNHKMFTLNELPEDVKQDLFNLINNYDKRIGFYVYHNQAWNDEHTKIEVKSMEIAYYVRFYLPDIMYNDWGIPCGARFWRMGKVAGGR